MYSEIKKTKNVYGNCYKDLREKVAENRKGIEHFIYRLIL